MTPRGTLEETIFVREYDLAGPHTVQGPRATKTSITTPELLRRMRGIECKVISAHLRSMCHELHQAMSLKRRLRRASRQ